MRVISKPGLATLLFLFLLYLLYSLPARIFVPTLGLETANVYPQGIDGAWHKGSAASVDIHTSGMVIRLHKMQWNVSVLRLLFGRLSADLNAEFSGKPVSVMVSRSVTGKLRVDDLFAEVNFDDIRPIMNKLIIPIDGVLFLRNGELTYNGRWFEGLEGFATLKNLVGTMPLGSIDVGEIKFSLDQAKPVNASADSGELNDGALHATIIDYQGAYGLSGSVSLQPNWAVAVNLASVPDSTVPPLIVQQMGFLFGAAVNGEYRLNYTDE